MSTMDVGTDLVRQASGDTNADLDTCHKTLSSTTTAQSYSTARALAARTEGWIAGLQLAALSLQGRDAEAKRQFVEAFRGSQRCILDYLVEEVLNRQPEHTQQFLLHTSVLEYMLGSLCNTLTGHDDGQAMLEALERANLFVLPMDEDRRWYRYHHLFAEVLRLRLQRAEPDLVPALHRKAATPVCSPMPLLPAYCCAHRWLGCGAMPSNRSNQCGDSTADGWAACQPAPNSTLIQSKEEKCQ